MTYAGPSWTILRTGLKEMGTNQPWKWRLTVLKTIKMVLIRPPHGQFQDDFWSWLSCSVRRPYPTQPMHPWNSPLKALAPWLARGSWFFGTWIHLLPRISGFLHKAIFHFTKHLSLSLGLLSNEKPNLSSVTILFVQSLILLRKGKVHKLSLENA